MGPHGGHVRLDELLKVVVLVASPSRDQARLAHPAVADDDTFDELVKDGGRVLGLDLGPLGGGEGRFFHTVHQSCLDS